jgi:phage replication-related protein YjqB (UPF0714/DUF867 family)
MHESSKTSESRGNMKKFSFLLAVVIALTLVWIGSAQADVYKNFQQLKARQDRNIDYRISYHNGPSSTLVMAIHGGSIEPGTCKLAKEVAKRSGADWYTFEGIKKKNNGTLHITSTRFNEPRAVSLVAQSNKTLSIHGCTGSSKITYVGGRDKQLAAKVRSKLKAAGFKIGTASSHLNGSSKYNICNENKINKGVQLEISKAQRNAFFSGGKNTDTFHRYAEALAKALND